MGQRKSEIIKNHMEVYWHDYASASKGIPITEAGLVEKSSVIGRTGLMLLECGTGAWRVRSSMNTLSRELGVTTTADIGLLSIEFTCFDGDQCYTQSLCLTNTGVNTSRLNRLEHLCPSTFTYRFKLILKANNLPLDLNVHSLRHTNASLLIAQGVDVRTVASLLGHAQASTTLDIYAHAFDKNKRKAQEKLGKAIGL